MKLKPLKDICPRCGKLRVMPQMDYGRYKAICKQCEREIKKPHSHCFYCSVYRSAVRCGAYALSCRA